MIEYTGETIEDLSIKSYILKAEKGTQRSTVNGDEVFHACVPVFNNHEWLGTLCIIWTSDIIDSET